MGSPRAALGPRPADPGDGEFRTLVQTHLACRASGAAIRSYRRPPPPAAPPVRRRSAGAQPPITGRGRPADSAVLLVHGVGNARPGDYLRSRGDQDRVGSTTAVYSLFYDVFNDWFLEKSQFARQVGRLSRS